MNLLDIIFIDLAYICASVFLISGVDDLAFDILFIIGKLFTRKAKRLHISDLDAVNQKPTAIIIPAWKEDKVIENMIKNNIKSIDYIKYDFFIGVYPNDEPTIQKVNELTRKYPNVHKVLCKHNGPTNKADNLNHIYEGLCKLERFKNVRYEVIVMHDAEDIIHPKELKLFNYYIPEYSFVQVPVFPLELSVKHFTYGTYIDEFAEGHFKDLDVRYMIKGHLPTAGVGAAFSRESLESLKDKNSGQIFNIHNLTEDYEIGIRLGMLNKKGLFLTQGVERTKYKRSFIFGKKKLKRVIEYIATREYFPRDIKSAVKQKSRWTMGIALQSWRQLGWKGSLVGKYTLLRDRKVLVINFVNFLGYGVFLYCSVRLLLNYLFNIPWNLNIIFPERSILWWIIIFDTAFLIWRICWKCYTVNKIYGGKQAFFSIPRSIWRNFISFLSTTIAIFSYITHLIKHKEVAWLKTDHDFPSEEELKEYKARLGDLLLENRLITLDQLDEALNLQSKTNPREVLGKILIKLGYITEDDFVKAYCQQLGEKYIDVDPYTIDFELLRRFPESLARRYNVMPIKKIEEKNTVVVASSDTIGDNVVKEIEKATGYKIDFRLAPGSDMIFGFDRAYMRLLSPMAEKTRMGDLLVQKGIITQIQLNEVLRRQRRSGEKLGEILISLNYISKEVLAETLSETFNLRFIRINKELIDPSILEKVPYATMKLYRFAPLYGKNQKILLAISKRLHEDVLNKIKGLFPDKDIEEVLALDNEIEQLIKQKEKQITLSEQNKIIEDSLEHYRIDFSKLVKKNLTQFFTKEFIRKNSIAPVKLDGDQLTIAILGVMDLQLLEYLYSKCINYSVQFVLSDEKEIEKACSILLEENK